ncbi:unnamed protein product [Tuber aestivum]|uniref:DUF7053 domain-containing protein n=1 Tax=Tuber aestivum TaxID=59557 RepID=A0A292Q0Z4_9PEZI|nr:unnamed protein product [Tuber aestivum]
MITTSVTLDTITSTILLPKSPPLTALVNFLQTPENLIALNPFVESFHRLPPPPRTGGEDDDSNIYTITDRIPIPFACGLTKTSTFTTEFSEPEGVMGLLSTSRAELGVVTGSLFWVEDSVGGVTVKERFKVYKSPFGMRWFIMMVARRARITMMERLEEVLVRLCDEQGVSVG